MLLQDTKLTSVATCSTTKVIGQSLGWLVDISQSISWSVGQSVGLVKGKQKGGCSINSTDLNK